ncbi:MAG: SWIB/MDM2 domain-containing protein [Quisquiliibacterium sp.]
MNADAKLREVFGKSKTDMFEMQNLLAKHLS